MFDTVAISQTFARPPNVDLLVKNGCQPIFSRYTGEPYRLTLNGEPDAKEPHLTFDRSPKGLWIMKAETSVGAWLYNSNLHLPDEKDMETFFQRLSEYVGDQTGRNFNPRIERVTRADMTRDFQLNESQVLPIIADLKNISLPKYDRQMFNDTGVYFVNKGKKKNKKYCVYSKYHEVISRNTSDLEKQAAKGLVRFEIQHKNNNAVANLGKSLKLPNHDANHILTRRVSETVIESAMNRLRFAPVFEDSGHLGMLFETYDSLTALKLAGHLAAKKSFGADYGKLSFINLSPKTIKGYERQCAKAGILSLE